MSDEGTVLDHYRAELARLVPYQIEHSEYRDFLTEAIARLEKIMDTTETPRYSNYQGYSDSRFYAAQDQENEDACRAAQEDETNEEHDDFGDYEDGWADHLEATYDPDNERIEDREV